MHPYWLPDSESTEEILEFTLRHGYHVKDRRIIKLGPYENWGLPACDVRGRRFCLPIALKGPDPHALLLRFFVGRQVGEIEPFF